MQSVAPEISANGLASRQVLDAERSVLAAMLLGDAEAGLSQLRAEHFYRNSHRAIFQALGAVHGRGDAVDTVSVAKQLESTDTGSVDRTALVQLVEYAPASANVGTHCRIVREAWAQRERHRVGLELAAGNLDSADAIERLETLGREEHAAAVEYLDLNAICEQGVPAVPWLIPGWLAEGDIALFAGDGGIGKSTTASAIALALAEGSDWCGIKVTRACSVLYYDEEQSDDEMARIFLSLSGAPRLPDTLRCAAQQGMNVTADLGRLEAELSSHRADVVVLDSVQQTFGDIEENDAKAVGRVFKSLMRLRKQHGTTFILVHHLKKPPNENRPALYHLIRGSVAFFTQSSTAWIATQPSRGVMDLVQYKRRRSEKASLRIQCEKQDGKVLLTAHGSVEDFDVVVERAQRFVVSFLANHGASRTADIHDAGDAEKLPRRSVERALKQLKELGNLDHPKRGIWRLTDATAAFQEMF